MAKRNVVKVKKNVGKEKQSLLVNELKVGHPSSNCFVYYGQSRG